MTLMLLRLCLALFLLPRRWKRRMYHVRKGVAYIVENSQWATKLAHRLGFHWIDKDTHITKDGVAVFAHWGDIAKNGVRIPRWMRRKYGKRPHIDEVSWADLSRIRSWTMLGRRYKFVRAVDGMALAASINMGIGWEYKGDKAMRAKSFWLWVIRQMAATGLDNLVAMTLPNMRGAKAMLIAAHEAGVPTMVIRAQDGVPRSWAPYMTYYRGPIKWLEGK